MNRKVWELQEEIDLLEDEVRWINQLIVAEMFHKEQDDDELKRLEMRKERLVMSLEAANIELNEVLTDQAGC